MPTSDPVIIPIEGDSSDFVADANKVNQSLDKMAAHTKTAGTTTATSMKGAAVSITDLRSAYMIAADAARVAGQVWQATGQEFVNRAEQVKNMSRSLGASAEETSRLIQVADDVRISYDSLKIAMKEAQKDGIDPNIEGLAKLADQYVAIQDPAEKTKFLLDKFGKSGLEMGKLMEKGGDGVRSLSDAIDENMIITEEGIKASDEYQHSLDELNDSWTAIKINIGSYLVGPATDLLNHYRDINTSLKENGYLYTLLHQFSLDDIAAKREQADAAFLAADGNKELGESAGESAGSVDTQKEAVKAAEAALNDYKDMLEEVSQANQDAESFIQSYADFQKGYEKDHLEAVEKIRQAEEDLLNVRENNTGASEGEMQEAIGEATNALYEARNEMGELQASWHESTQAMIYDMMMAKVSVDGLTDAEFKATQQLAVTMGLRTQAQADEANAMMDQATALADGIALQEDVMKEKADADVELLRLENEKALAAGETTTAIVDGSAVSVESLNGVAMAVDSATQSYIAMAAAAWDAAAAAQSAGSGSGGSSSGSSGGSGGGSTPVSSSSATKNSIFNISITNPIGDNSASSIRRTLRQIDYLGHPI